MKQCPECYKQHIKIANAIDELLQAYHLESNNEKAKERIDKAIQILRK